MSYDVAVVGLGGMGSAILAQCAARGARAIGLEQFEPGHERGSSTGRSRLIRKAYFEDSAYVPLLLRAYDLWRELERAAGEEILTITGLLLVGEESSPVITGARRAAAAHHLALEVLGPRESRRAIRSCASCRRRSASSKPTAACSCPSARPPRTCDSLRRQARRRVSGTRW